MHAETHRLCDDNVNLGIKVLKAHYLNDIAVSVLLNKLSYHQNVLNLFFLAVVNHTVHFLAAGLNRLNRVQAVNPFS